MHRILVVQCTSCTLRQIGYLITIKQKGIFVKCESCFTPLLDHIIYQDTSFYSEQGLIINVCYVEKAVNLIKD